LLGGSRCHITFEDLNMEWYDQSWVLLY
jgi:hypothetical protein